MRNSWLSASIDLNQFILLVCFELENFLSLFFRTTKLIGTTCGFFWAELFQSLVNITNSCDRAGTIANELPIVEQIPVSFILIEVCGRLQWWLHVCSIVSFRCCIAWIIRFTRFAYGGIQRQRNCVQIGTWTCSFGSFTMTWAEYAWIGWMKFGRQVRVHMTNRQILSSTSASRHTKLIAQKFVIENSTMSCHVSRVKRCENSLPLAARVNPSLMPPVPDCFTLFTLRTVHNRNNGKLLYITNIQPPIVIVELRVQMDCFDCERNYLHCWLHGWVS